MSQFKDREKGFESKDAHDKELDFKAMARRNKLLGLWAAELLGISGTEADAYAKEVVMSDFDEPGDEDVFRKVYGDFQSKNVDISEHVLRTKMDSLLGEARAQVRAES